jgi:hypothetical protein
MDAISAIQPITTISSGDARRDARLTALLAAKLARENGVSISPATSTLAPKPYPPRQESAQSAPPAGLSLSSAVEDRPTLNRSGWPN